MQKDHDAVNHPPHYTSNPSGVECIDVTRHMNFTIGNAVKYLWRAGLKRGVDKSQLENHLEDLKKAVWYINDEIKTLEGSVHHETQYELEIDDEEKQTGRCEITGRIGDVADTIGTRFVEREPCIYCGGGNCNLDRCRSHGADV